MVATREIFWNVGRVVVWPMYLLSFLAIAFCAWGLLKRLPIYQLYKSLNRFDCLSERIKRLIGEVFGQKKGARVKDGGLFHSLFF